MCLRNIQEVFLPPKYLTKPEIGYKIVKKTDEGYDYEFYFGPKLELNTTICDDKDNEIGFHLFSNLDDTINYRRLRQKNCDIPLVILKCEYNYITTIARAEFPNPFINHLFVDRIIVCKMLTLLEEVSITI